MSNPLRIGTRASALAKVQATLVQALLTKQAQATTLVLIESLGDAVQDVPLPALGGTGIFTKALDDALQAGTIDMAVHSCKDLPTALPEAIVLAALLPREQFIDVLVLSPETAGKPASLQAPLVIGTSSNRRSAQWLNRYRHHVIKSIRGNVPTRLAKVQAGEFDGALFAMAGLQRLGLQAAVSQSLGWMLPAAGQGAIAVTCLKDSPILPLLQALNHPATQLCVQVERAFLHNLQAGCTAPVGALAVLEAQGIRFKGGVFSLDGTAHEVIDELLPLQGWEADLQQLTDQLLPWVKEVLQDHIRTGR